MEFRVIVIPDEEQIPDQCAGGVDSECPNLADYYLAVPLTPGVRAYFNRVPTCREHLVETIDLNAAEAETV